MLHPISDIRFSKISADIDSYFAFRTVKNKNKINNKKLQEPKEFPAELLSRLDKSDSNSLVCFIPSLASYLQLACIALLTVSTIPYIP